MKETKKKTIQVKSVARKSFCISEEAPLKYSYLGWGPHLIFVNGVRWEYSSTTVDTFRFPSDFWDFMVELVLQISSLSLRSNQSYYFLS